MATIEAAVEKFIADKEIDRIDECAALTILTWLNEDIASARKISSFYVDRLIVGGWGTARGGLNVDTKDIAIWFCLALNGCYGLMEMSHKESPDATD